MKQEEKVELLFKATNGELSGRDICTPERQEKAERIYRERVMRNKGITPQIQRNIFYRFILRIFSSLGIKSAQ